jgi:hypothetical protein
MLAAFFATPPHCPISPAPNKKRNPSEASTRIHNIPASIAVGM